MFLELQPCFLIGLTSINYNEKSKDYSLQKTAQKNLKQTHKYTPKSLGVFSKRPQKT